MSSILTPAGIADQYAWHYTKLPVPVGTWTYLFPTDGCWAALLETEKAYYIMFRGSTSFLDWVEDFAADATPIWDPKLGWVHPGFRIGVLLNIGWINAHITNAAKAVVAVGHSLGAGHAALWAGYRALDGLRMDELVLYGSPRPGGQQLKNILAKAKIQVTSYRNVSPLGHDEVTDVPVDIEVDGIGIQYLEPGDFTEVCAEPPKNDLWGPFSHHHFSLYCKALGATGPAAMSLQL